MSDPEILGLGDLTVRETERRQPRAGRLDMLLENPDPEYMQHFEVELMLGKVDESHIIRCIEYWDTERRRFPRYEHMAVLIAEELTSRWPCQFFCVNAVPIKSSVTHSGALHAARAASRRPG